MADLVPAALLLRPFLTPYDRARILILAHDRLVLFGGEGIELLEPHDRGRFDLRLAASSQQIEVHFPAAQHDTRHRRGMDLVDLVDHRPEAAPGELLEARRRERMAQQALRR